MGIGEPERWLIDILRAAPRSVECLKAVRDLGLSDCWIGAGFVRNKVWDVLHGYAAFTELNDVDVVYFNAADTDRVREAEHEQRLAAVLSDVPWSVRNQARMHIRNREAPYIDTADAMSRWVQTATAVGARIDEEGEIHILAPHGLDDLVNLILRPTPSHADRRDMFEALVAEKRWLEIWPKLKVV